MKRARQVRVRTGQDELFTPLHGRVAVISPHCDDAVLSLGAALSAHVRSGGRAVAVTVLAGNVTSTSPAGPWDATAGFASECEATLSRRAEDVAALGRLGVEHHHVAGRDEQYRSGAVEDGLWDEIQPIVHECDELLLPGFPLRHLDHLSVTALVLRRIRPERRVRLYVEEPYALRERRTGRGDAWGPAVRWYPIRAPRRDVLAKLHAAAAYRSQLPLLGPGRFGSPSRVGGAVLLAQLGRAAGARGEWVTQALPAGALSTAPALQAVKDA